MTYQERQRLSPKETTIPQLATIDKVLEDGVTLIFDGDTVAGLKSYPVNTAVLFSPGDRVRIEKIGGTFVVAYPIGAPRKG